MKLVKTSTTEKALLVVVDWIHRDDWTDEDSLIELVELVKTTHTEVKEKVVCRLDRPNSAYFIGKGKVEEIVQISRVNDIDVVVFSEDLSGTQQRNLEEIIKIKTIDRTQLILDIFSQHAKSPEGNLQVELAQLEYLLPRLAGKGIVLSRLGGGIGTRGPGEKKIEVDRRRIRSRITKLKRDLKDLSAHRRTIRKKRAKNILASVALVGYTNAGKSTVLNALTGANQIVKNSLFTTLDPLSRNLTLPNKQTIVISDTVGFLYHLPHHLIEAFKATLEEVKEADVLLNVLDISHPKFIEHNKAVCEVLKQLQSVERPTITILNKIDLVADKTWIRNLEEDFPNTVTISALNKENINELIEKITNELSSSTTLFKAIIPFNRMDLVDLIHREGQVKSKEFTPEGINIRAILPSITASKIMSYKDIVSLS